LELLLTFYKNTSLLIYLRSGKRASGFWCNFWPEWDRAYPELDADELREELEEAEEAFKKATARVKEKNKATVKSKGRRKAKLMKLPTPSDRMNELCACGSDHVVRSLSLGLLFLR
jgi:hypothetical protein